MRLFLQTIAGTLITAIFNVEVFRLIPFTSDLSDWGGLSYPRSYLLPLLILSMVAYISAWIGAKISAATGRLCGILGSIVTVVVVLIVNLDAPVLDPLFNHPAYPVFSDHALLAVAILLMAGHLGGLRVEKNFIQSQEKLLTVPDKS